MKRLLALITMFSLLIIPISQAANTYSTEIDWMVSNSIMTENADGLFRPDDCANRAEFLKVLYSMKGGMTESESNFSDVPEGVWFESYVGSAVKDGVVQGFADGTFKPAQCVTRAEGVKMAITAFSDTLPDEGTNPTNQYLDINESDWFYETMTRGLSLSVVGEYHVWSDDPAYRKFLANEAMTRKEVAALLYRIQAVIDNKAEFYDTWMEPAPMGELFTKACTIDKSNMVKDVPLEWGMHEDSNVVLKVDGNNRGQLKQFAKHIDEIGGGEVWSMLIDQYDWAVADDLSYEAIGEEIIMDDWQIGMSWLASDNPEGDFAIAVSVDQYNEFQHVIGTMIWNQYGANVDCEVNDAYTLWTVEWDDLYVLRYGDLFMFANSDEYRQTLLTQILNEDGFDEITEDALVYGWVDVATSVELYAEIFGDDLESLNDIDEVEFTFETSTEGFRFSSDTSFTSAENEILLAYSDQSLELVDRVPAGDLLLYFEDQDLSLIVDSVFELLAPNEDLYTELGEEFDFAPETLQILAESGYAFSMADSGEIIPDMAFYLDLTDKNEKALAAELTIEFDEWIATIAEDAGLVQDESVVGEMRKWDNQDESIDYDISLYYGLIEEDVYVVAINDDFMSEWGSTSVEDLKRFELASENIDRNNVAQVQFIDFKNMIPWMEALAASPEAINDAEILSQAATWLEQLGSLYGASYVTNNDILRQEVFWDL